MADGLFGIKKPSKTQAKNTASSTSLTFSSNLSALISKSSSQSTGRKRPSKSKSDIFTAHNKNVKKRMQDDADVVEASELHRSKRKMEDKVRIYNAMKRGEYIVKDDNEERSLVDFDRKWAESNARGDKDEEADSSGSDDGSNEEEETVEWLDEFGRLRKGTKAQAAREERRKRMQANAVEEEERLSARPKMPDNVIYGDAVQHSAFNPDQVVADRMADLAKKRDKSATPPPNTHYDANAEVRTKGTGFYTFSHDAETRKKEMAALERDRLETERARQEREQKKEQRKRELEERRKLISEQRSKAQADKFLSELEFGPS